MPSSETKMKWTLDEWFKYLISPGITILGSGALIHWLTRRDKLIEQRSVRLSVANNVRAFELEQRDWHDQKRMTMAYRINPYWIYMDTNGMPRVHRHPELILREWDVIENCIVGTGWLTFDAVKRAAREHKWLVFKLDVDYGEWVNSGSEPMTVDDEHLFQPLPRRTKLEHGVKERL